jgi:hypothetical protein
VLSGNISKESYRLWLSFPGGGSPALLGLQSFATSKKSVVERVVRVLVDSIPPQLPDFPRVGFLSAAGTRMSWRRRLAVAMTGRLYMDEEVSEVGGDACAFQPGDEMV